MKGINSNSTLFKTYPKVILNLYQGSMKNTSQEVEKIFKRAREIYANLKPEDKEKNISLIVFDQIDLTEHSPNNPLKVINNELEYDLNKGNEEIAFVGISNRFLDDSIMNRGMVLAIPDLDLREMRETALTIGKSYNDL
jgi:GTPase SAR1 family protein